MSRLYCRRLYNGKDSHTGKRNHFLPTDVESKYAPDKTCQIRHIRLDLTIDLKGKSLKGGCSIALAPYGAKVSCMELDSVDLAIEQVRSKKRGNLPHEVGREKLRIGFPAPIEVEEEEILTIDYSVTEPARGFYFVAPDDAYPEKPLQAWSQGEDEDARYWFPCFDAPHEKSTTEMVATVPRGFLALSNGKLLSVREDSQSQTQTYHWFQEVPHTTYLISFVVGEFVEVKRTIDDLPVHNYVAPGRQEECERSFGKTPEMIRFFSERIGVPYPYAKYAQVAVTDFVFGSMENTSMTTLTDLTLHDEKAHLDFSSDGLVAHELAHQWFGNLVTCRHWSHTWLNEGFATYFDALFKEHDLGQEEFRYELYRMAERYFKEGQESYRRRLVTRKFRQPIDLFDHHLYEKGALILHMLRFELGDELFWKSIQHYTESHGGKNVETVDRRAIEQVTGRNLEQFFDQWVFHAGYPELKVSFDWDAALSVAAVKLTQHQELTEETPIFRFAAQVRFQGKDWTETCTIKINEKEQTYHFPLKAKPIAMAFDLGNWILKTVELDCPKEMLLYQLRNDPDSMVRVAAVKALSNNAGRDETLALGEALSGDRFWGVQREAAKALGKIHSPFALKMLSERGLAVAQPKVRREVAKALGEFRDRVSAKELLKLLEQDDSYFVAAEAAKALGKSSQPFAFDALEKNAKRLKRRVAETMESIRSSRKQADEIRRIQESLDSLREENLRLKDRFDQWVTVQNTKAPDDTKERSKSE